MGLGIKKGIKEFIFNFFSKLIPEIRILRDPEINFSLLESSSKDSKIEKQTKLVHPFRLNEVEIGRGTYIASNSVISMTAIGRFCSIGPNFLCGWGIHPTTGISTSPVFYSTYKQNGYTYALTNKIEERKKIIIGNDVFIGANVFVLDGVTIGDGVVIGAGAVVSKDIPPYAIAVGCPIHIIKYRFPEEIREKLKNIQWWNFEENALLDVEKLIF